jgi:hypothetical protein
MCPLVWYRVSCRLVPINSPAGATSSRTDSHERGAAEITTQKQPGTKRLHAGNFINAEIPRARTTTATLDITYPLSQLLGQLIVAGGEMGSSPPCVEVSHTYTSWLNHAGQTAPLPNGGEALTTLITALQLHGTEVPDGPSSARLPFQIPQVVHETSDT